MTAIRRFMTDDHRHCDDIFADVEQAVARKDQKAAQDAFDKFRMAMLAHFQGEEETLFPSFEAFAGSASGPTRVMRMEHQQLRALLEEASETLGTGDIDAYLGLADTLVIMMQQHNMKEENILYPMCDQHLAAEASTIVARLEEALAGHAAP